MVKILKIGVIEPDCIIFPFNAYQIVESNNSFALQTDQKHTQLRKWWILDSLDYYNARDLLAI